jgi:hypothetical protein
MGDSAGGGFTGRDREARSDTTFAVLVQGSAV